MSREYFAQQDNYYILSNEFLKYCREAYINEESEALNPYFSPLEAELSDDMPDALVITAQCDPLRDEGRLYAEKLRKSGIHTEFIEYKHMTHAFMPFYPIIKSAREAIDVVADFVAVH